MTVRPRRGRARLLPAVLVLALIATGCTTAGDSGEQARADGAPGDGGGPVRVEPSRPTPPMSTPTEAAPVAPGPDAVRVAPGDDLQAAVDDNPPGTDFVLDAGTHRGVQVRPKDGNTFVGESGAVVSGAEVLTGWRPEGGRWVIDGQTAEGLVYGEVEPGRERDRHSEDLWIDDRLLTHVGSPDVGPGEWHFDYAADRIWLGEDPAAGSVQLAVLPWAFSSEASDVTLSNLVVERYASAFQHGAVGGGPLQGNMHRHQRWTLDHMTLRFNHGIGARLGPGATVRHSKFVRNGEMGLGVSGRNRRGGASTADGDDPVVIRFNEFTGNRTLGFDVQAEGGAMKIAWTTAGSVFEHNWSHGNRGPGVWFDIDNRDAMIRNNRIEYNDGPGIFYEISFGDTVIEDNLVRGNTSHGVLISTSQGVVVRDNVVYGNGGDAIQVRDNDRGGSDDFGPYRGQDVLVEDNHVLTDSGEVAYRVMSGRAELVDPAVANVRFVGNTYLAGRGQPFSWGLARGDDGPEFDFETWQRQFGMDRDGSFAQVEPPPDDADVDALPDDFVEALPEFTPSSNYGQR